MRSRQLITVFTLISFLLVLFVVAGCSKSRRLEFDSDPASAGATEQLQDGQPVQISGYTRLSDGYRDFDGHVWFAAPDSLVFMPKQGRTRPASVFEASFKLACEDVISVDTVVPDKGKTRAVVTATVLVVGAAVVTAVVTIAISSGNMDPWF